MNTSTDKQDVQRYELYADYVEAFMNDVDDGDYVLYSDYEALLKEKDEAAKSISRINKELEQLRKANSLLRKAIMRELDPNHTSCSDDLREALNTDPWRL